MSGRAGGVRVGCCGFPVARSKYTAAFNVVEVQKTFYDIPSDGLLEKWRSEVPAGFEFTIKAWQLITHSPASPTYRRLREKIPEEKQKRYGYFKPTDEVMAAWKKTARAALILKAEKIIFQCPASFGPTKENISNIKRFFSKIKREGFTFGWEPRGRWPGEKILDICRTAGVVHVVDPFKSKALYGKINYFRLHGKGGYNYRYTDSDLLELKAFLSRRKTNYVMFNNIHMFDDARRFKALIEGEL